MGQAISFILRHLLGGTRTAETIKPVLNEDYSPVLPSYHMDFIEEHNHKSSAATATFHQLYQLAEHDLCQPRIATNSIAPSTVGSVEKTKELIAKAVKEATTSTNSKSKRRGKKKSPENEEVISFHRHDRHVTIPPQKQQQQVVSSQLAEDDLCQPRIATNSIVASIVGSVEETKELIAKAAKEATTSTNSKRKKRRRREKKSPKSEEVISFHRYDRDVTIPPQKQQRQQVMSGQLAEDDLCQPRIATNSIVASTVGSVEETKELIAKATKEATASMNSKKKRRRRRGKKKSPKSEEIISFHRHNCGVTILPQKQPREQVMSVQLVEHNLRQPSIATNSIIAIPVGSVQETKELIAKAAKEATTSTNSKKKRRRRGEKKSLKSEEVISFHRHDRDVTIPPQKQQRQQVVSCKLAEHNLRQPHIASNSVTSSTVGSVEETKELIAKATKGATTSTNSKKKRRRGKKKSPKNEEVISFHRHDRGVTIPPQKQQRQQVVSGQLVEDNLRQPLVETSSIVASTVGSVEETKELIAKATKEATTSTNSKRKRRRRGKKKSPENEEVISFHRYDHGVTIPPQKQQQHQVVSGQLSKDNLHQPLVQTNSIVASTISSVEETEELIAKATKEATTSTNSKRKRRRRGKKKSPENEEVISFHRHDRGVTIPPQEQQRQQVVSSQLAEDNVRQPLVETNFIVACTVGCVEETKELIAKAAKEATASKNNKKKRRRRRKKKKSPKNEEVISFHQHDCGITIPPQKQQRQQVALGQLVEYNLHQPLVQSNSIVASTITSVEDTKELIAKGAKEATTATNSKRKRRRRGKKKSPKNEEVISFHRYDRGATIPPQKQQRQQVMSGQLAEDNVCQPLVETNFIVASTVGSVEETKELIAKAAKEAISSTNSKKKRRWRGKKKSPENEEVISFHQHDCGVAIPPQIQRQQVMSSQLAEDNLSQPLVETNSIVASTISSVEETKELIAKAANKATTSTNSKKKRRRRGKKKRIEHEEVISFHRHDRGVTIPPQKQQRQQVVSGQLAKDNVCQPLGETNSIVASTIGSVEETKELIAKAAKEATTSTNSKMKRRRRGKKKSPENEEVISFHPHDCGVAIPPQKQRQHQVVSGQLTEDNLSEPLVETNSIVASTAGNVEETKELIAIAVKEATTSPNSKKNRRRRGKKKIPENEEVISFHRHDRGVTIPLQKQQRLQVVSSQLAEDNVRQPLVETNFIVANTLGSVEETKDLIAKAAKEATASTNSKKKRRWRGKKKSPKNEEVISFHQHDCGVAIPPQKQRQQVMSSQLTEDNLSEPLVDTNSIVASTASSVEETKEPIAIATKEETTSPNSKKKRRRGKKKIPENEEVISCHRHDRGVTIPPQKQQQQEVMSRQLGEDNLRQPLVETSLIVASTIGSVEERKELIAKAAKEATTSMNSKKKRRWGKKKSLENKEVIEFHLHYRDVTISPQRLERQKQEAVLDQLVEDDLHQPLIATNSIIASTASNVEKTKELITTVVKEEANSRERKRNKKMKSTENEEAIRKIGPYVHSHKILLVGEGDFSFSASLAVAFGHASNIVATSLNNKEYLQKNYKDVMANIKELESRGALVFHGVDATKMADHDQLLSGMTFDRIIFNFPHTGYFANTTSDLSRNQMLVVGFLRNAKQMIEEHGEIHVTHKTSTAFIKWKIVELASAENLYLIKESPFDPKVYRGYHTKFGFRGNKNFNCYPCSSYKFGISCGGLSA